jgi:hypothetical protein
VRRRSGEQTADAVLTVGREYLPRTIGTRSRVLFGQRLRKRSPHSGVAIAGEDGTQVFGDIAVPHPCLRSK